MSRKPAAVLLLATMVAAAAAAQVAEGVSPTVEVGGGAPDFALRSLSGEVHRLSDLEGERPAVVVFFRGAW